MHRQPSIVLCTLNARYSHASFGLRYLRANLGPWRSNSRLLEFTIHDSPAEVAERVLALEPDIVGFGVYIWNLVLTAEVVSILRAVRPDLKLVIGGPEVSHEYEGTEIVALADHLITGEADVAFRELVARLVVGDAVPKVIHAEPPDVAMLCFPYDEYTEEDLSHRLLYVEASRGCPFSCEFCLSSLDRGVRAFPLHQFLAELDKLLARGARAFKFVDRTFNLNVQTSAAILEFCLERYRPGFELHFEMIPDRLPLELRRLISRFPPGAVQFEIGVQSLDDGVTQRISRRQNLTRMEENFRFLRDETHVHVHADLIFGLPGETLESFAQGFDRLLAMAPAEIQIGILKRLKGTPIVRHIAEYGMVFSARPPYEVLQTNTVSFLQMQRVKRFARYFELYYNSGDFKESLGLLFEHGPGADPLPGPFGCFLHFSDWLYAKTGKTHAFAKMRLYELLFAYLTSVAGVAAPTTAASLLRDYDRNGRRRARPEFLRPFLGAQCVAGLPTR